MPEFEAVPSGFGYASLAFVGYVSCAFAVAVGVTSVLPDQWFLLAFLATALLLLVPFLRVFRRLTPATPGTADTE
jgi:hypothetical protein